MTDQCAHYWTEAERGWECIECDATCEACIECRRWTGGSLLICDPCVKRTRRLLDDIEVAIALYSPSPASIIPAIRYDKDRISGDRGDDFDPARWTWSELHQFLVGWADLWAEEAGKDRTTPPLEFMRGHILWAAHNEGSDWDQWRAEMKRALHTAKREAGLLPKRMAAPCAHCGGTVVQTWATKRLEPHPDGLSDEVECLGCGLTWRSAEAYRHLSKTHLQGLPMVRPDALVTIAEAHLVWPDVPAKTWSTWASRAELPDPAGWDERGRAQYRVGDLDVLAERRVDTSRRGRRAG